jgi:hypothetical protein
MKIFKNWLIYRSILLVLAVITASSIYYNQARDTEEHGQREYVSDESRLSSALSTIARYEQCGGEVLLSEIKDDDTRPDYCKNLWCGTPLEQAYHSANSLTGMSRGDLRVLALASRSVTEASN